MLIYALLKVYSNHKDRVLAALKENEKTISKNLVEKGLLLKEIHHRVKNNLQVMMSLLRLKSSYLNNEELNVIIKEIIDKIYSIALIHEKLYSSNQLSEVDFKSYIQDISNHLVHVHKSTGEIAIEYNTQEIKLPIDKSVPCGIILNEILTNSLKYAFPDNRKGIIKITFILNDRNKYELAVEDNGIGFGEKGEDADTQSFGLSLIGILAEQLEASKDIISGKAGTRIRLVFS